MMPHTVLKKVWNYSIHNKTHLLLILFLIIISNYLSKHTIDVIDYSFDRPSLFIATITLSLILIFITGYGLSIIHDIINNGERLPKIKIKKIISYGIKGIIIIYVLTTIQSFLINLICIPLHFPEFDLEELLVDTHETLHLLYTHSPTDLIIFLIAGAIIYFITMFFMEVAIARLADKDKLLHSLNIVEIFRDINTIGGINYSKEFILIMIAMVILIYMGNIKVDNPIANFLINNVFEFGVYITQFVGIGIAYSHIKTKIK